MSRRADSATTEGEAGPKPEPKKSPAKSKRNHSLASSLTTNEALA